MARSAGRPVGGSVVDVGQARSPGGVTPALLLVLLAVSCEPQPPRVVSCEQHAERLAQAVVAVIDQGEAPDTHLPLPEGCDDELMTDAVRERLREEISARPEGWTAGGREVTGEEQLELSALAVIEERVEVGDDTADAALSWPLVVTYETEEVLGLGTRHAIHRFRGASWEDWENLTIDAVVDVDLRSSTSGDEPGPARAELLTQLGLDNVVVRYSPDGAITHGTLYPIAGDLAVEAEFAHEGAGAFSPNRLFNTGYAQGPAGAADPDAALERIRLEMAGELGLDAAPWMRSRSSRTGSAGRVIRAALLVAPTWSGVSWWRTHP